MPSWLRREAPKACDRLLAEALRARFVVTMHDESSIEGLLVDVDERVLVLAQCSTRTAAGGTVGIDGAVYLERSRVLYMQRPDGLPAPEVSA
jgi:hypothetical protein